MKQHIIGNSRVFNMDCMELMAQYPDKYFDLAVVDPPYGIKEDGKKNHSRSCIAKAKEYTPKDWDSKTPESEYFEELFRVSQNVIIWGANHFIQTIGASGNNTNSPCWIVWDKENGDNDFADCELAFTSFKTAVRKFKFKWAGMFQGDMKNKEKRIHPTQKPVALYDWIFKNYAKEGMKILDTHLGSGSSRIAADKAKLDFTACELDEEYFDASVKRFEQYKQQLRIF